MRLFVVGFLVGSLILSTRASAVTLYDGSLGTAPSSQGWLSHYTFNGGTETVGATKTTYDASAADNTQGGYSTHTFVGTLVNPSSPVLDRTTGYTVSVDLKLLSENHSSNDRAGLSLIVLSSDHQGIELGFWNNEIWEQSGPAFTHGLGTAYDPTAAIKTYDLVVSGSNYTLLGNGSPIRSGTLKDYSTFGFPYTTTNWIFVGDDTTSARGAFEISRLAVTVPEPAGMLLFLLPVAVCSTRKIRLASK